MFATFFFVEIVGNWKPNPKGKSDVGDHVFVDIFLYSQLQVNWLCVRLLTWCVKNKRGSDTVPPSVYEMTFLRIKGLVESLFLRAGTSSLSPQMVLV